MNPVKPEIPAGSNLIVFGKDQPEYIPLPTAVDPMTGTIVTEWELSAEELAQLMFNDSRIRLTILYTDLDKPFKPIKLEVIR